jgi:hypothetical protein
VEFLADDLVQEDVAEFLPDEFVLDAPEGESGIVFAAPSDAPPRGALYLPHTAPGSMGTRPVRHPRPLLAACAGAAAGLVVVFALARRMSHEAPPAAWEKPVTVPLRPALSEPTPAMSSGTVEPVYAAPAAPSAPATSASPSAPTGAADAAAPGWGAASATPDPDAAGEAKLAAQKALDRGQVSLAIDLAQRAVDLDPTDAESWLTLGAAYLQRGKYKDARRCFSNCVAQATHGARSECAALLR